MTAKKRDLRREKNVQSTPVVENEFMDLLLDEPAAVEVVKAPVPVPVEAQKEPAKKKVPESILSTKKKSMLAKNDKHFLKLARDGVARDFPKDANGKSTAETFTVMDEMMTALDTFAAADFEADKLNYFLQLGAFNCIAYPVKKGHVAASFSREISEGFVTTTKDELEVLFGDEEGIDKIAAMFQEAVEATPKKQA